MAATSGRVPWYAEYFPNYGLTGTLDSLRLYNCALSATQIQALAQASTDTGAAPTMSITSPTNNTIWAGNVTITAHGGGYG